VRITVLGSGSSGGVPMVGLGWGNCDPNNQKNVRLRSSLLIETMGKIILIDTSPDLRAQLLAAKCDTHRCGHLYPRTCRSFAWN
jgi:phosphoribosyl 1,2-cyclic phosphate phosphodiesterase